MSSKLSSFFRSKSETPSPRRSSSRPFSRILSPARPKQDDDPSSAKGIQPPTDNQSSVTQLPLDPHSSPVSNFDSHSDARQPFSGSDGRWHSRDHEDPPGAHSPAANGDSNIYSEDSEMDEREMKRKLMDLESSFLPDSLPPAKELPAFRQSGRPHNRSVQSDFMRANKSLEDISFNRLRSSAQRTLSATRSASYKAPASVQSRHVEPVPEVDEVDTEGENSMASMHHSLSSPSVAAAQRSRLRAAAAGFSPLRNATTLALVSPDSSQNQDKTLQHDSSNIEPTRQESSTYVDNDAPGPNRTSEEPASQRSSGEEDDSKRYSDSHTSRPSREHRVSLEPPKTQSTTRSSFPNGRHSDQRSSSSSYLSNEAASELAGANSGGATPGSVSTVRPGHELSRLPSLGSVASTMSVHTDRSASHRRKRTASGVPIVGQETNLTPVAEDKGKIVSPPGTPQVAINSVTEPRQTVVAQHVRDVKVPATVARKYKAGLGPGTETRSSTFASPNFGRGKGDLTLKEQNGRIDKLSKENFDLKLKIHYLYQALQDRSDEGVKELISKNAQLSTDVIKVRKENQSLRKHVKELERELRSKDDGLSAARTVSESEDVVSSRSWQQAQLEDEIFYLRDRMQATEEDNARLRQGDASREYERRRMADQVKSMNSSEQATLLRDELEQERSRRERAEHEAQHLRVEASRLKASRSPVRDLRSHPRNAQTEAQGLPALNPSSSLQEVSSLSGTTVVDQLRQENADLRRDLGAQTSMLTSRNRERERLQQEIEDLKLLQRRGDGLQSQNLSVSGDSVLDRSVSRNNFRPNSRASGSGKTDQLSESEKDKYETKQAALRDENAALRMRIQDLQGELDMLTGSAEHLESLRTERDEALILIEEERDFAADTIDRLEEQAEQKDRDINQLFVELRAKEDESQTLEREMREIGASLSNVVDESEKSYTTIQDLQQDLAVANGELEAAQFNLREAVAAKERLEVQAESSQNEISFLREEQEADKIKLSDLQSALSRAKTNLRDEKERLQEFEEMETETKKARDEARRLRKSLNSKDDEIIVFRENLEELEEGLRQALNTTERNRPSLLKLVVRTCNDLNDAQADLETSQGGLEEKHQRLQDHIMLLESCEAERQRLAGLLEKEKQSRQRTQLELERTRSSPAGSNRIAELEQARMEDQQHLAALEEHFTVQSQERNKVMFELWTRLATLCGTDWLENFSATSKQTAPTFELVSEEPNSIDAPISMALDTISQTLSTFRTRIRSTEKDMYKDLEALSNDLDTRSKRIDALERNLARRSGNMAEAGAPAPADLNRLKDENRLLRRELKILKQGAFALPGLSSPQHELDTAAQEAKLIAHERDRLSPVSPTSNRTRRPRGGHADDENSALQRHQPPAATSLAEAPGSEYAGSGDVPGVNGKHAALAPNEQLWILRLKELERRLKAEREGRLLDRSGARKKLEERDNQIGGLRRELEMEKERKAMIQTLRDGDASVGKEVE